MSSRKTTVFYGLLIGVASLAVGMVIASRLDLSPPSMAQPARSPCRRPTARRCGGPSTPARSATSPRPSARRSSTSGPNRGSGRRSSPSSSAAAAGRPARAVLRRAAAARPAGSRPREQVAVAAGTGFIISKDGYILTNNHVVEGATKIEVSLYDEDDVSYQARVIGRDPLTDSALIELTEKPAHAARRSQVRRLGADGAGRLGDGHRQSRSASRTRSASASSAPRVRAACPSPTAALPTSFRPTPRSIPATRADRCSTCAAK